MQGLGRTFDVEETRVESAEPLHMPMLGAMTSHQPNCTELQEVSQTSVCMAIEQNPWPEVGYMPGPIAHRLKSCHW